MQNTIHASGLGAIVAKLAASSKRPRYVILVLQLVGEAANVHGRAGPFVMAGNHKMALRDWLCAQLMPLSERDDRRSALRTRVAEQIAHKLSGDAEQDKPVIDAALDEHVLCVGRANISRAISDLVRAGLVRRHYAGYATNHANRGGGRHAVYVLEQDTLAALGRPVMQSGPAWVSRERQGQLFAA